MTPGYDAVILAGGQARRLGGLDKPGLDVGRRSLVENVVAAVPAAGRVIVVGPPRDLPGVLFTREDPPGAGPIPALRAGLAHVTAPWVILLAADLPFLNVHHLTTLLTAAHSLPPHLATAPDRPAHLAATDAPTGQTAPSGLSRMVEAPSEGPEPPPAPGASGRLGAGSGLPGAASGPAGPPTMAGAPSGGEEPHTPPGASGRPEAAPGPSGAASGPPGPPTVAGAPSGGEEPHTPPGASGRPEAASGQPGTASGPSGAVSGLSGPSRVGGASLVRAASGNAGRPVPAGGGSGVGPGGGVVAVDGEGREQWLLGVWDVAGLREALGRYEGRSLRGLLAPLARARVALPRRAWFDCDTVDDLEEARMNVLAEWTALACKELGIDPARVDRDQILELTKEVAHGVARPAAPLTAYLLGLAEGAGTAPEEAVARLTTLARNWGEATAETLTDS